MIKSRWLGFKGNRLALAGRYEEALPYLSRAYKIDPGNYSNSFLLAECFYYSKVYEKALEIFREVERWNPENPDVMGYIGACLFKLGRNEEAEEYLQRAVSLFQKFPEVLYILGKICLMREDRGSAYNYFKKAMALDPTEMFRLYDRYKKFVKRK